jgi:uncharacterized protein with GYD domain
MPLFMSQFAYTSEAWAAMAKKPEDREVVLRTLVEKMGGKLHALYFCFGEYDGVAIFEMPDETTAVAGVVAVVAPGHIKATKTTVLFTMQDMLEALRKAGTVVYPPPKG